MYKTIVRICKTLQPTVECRIGNSIRIKVLSLFVRIASDSKSPPIANKKARQCAHNFNIKNTYSAYHKYFNPPIHPPRRERTNAPRTLWGRGGGVQSATGGGIRATPPLSLRRSTINVENVVVRLWQSSAICLRANARSAFLFTGSPRSARDDKGRGVSAQARTSFVIPAQAGIGSIKFISRITDK